MELPLAIPWLTYEGSIMSERLYTPAPLTVHDYLELPEGGPRYQLVDGDLHMAPAPNFFHQEIIGRIFLLLGKYLERNPVGALGLSPLDVFLTETNVFQPDLLFFTNERASIKRADGVHGAPDLVIEVLSPGTSRLDQGSKKRVYARCGVTELWLIAPDAREVTVYNLRASATEPAATWREGDVFTCAFFPGLQIETARFFAA
jgi:Uma2 family endonuclease